MRKLFIPLSIVLPIAAILAFSALKFNWFNSEKKEGNPAKPYDYFSQVRSYPDKQMDVKAFEEALYAATAQNKNASALTFGNWQLEGPTNIGGRITCMAVSPTNSNVIFIGTPGSGIYKTTNGGSTWTAVFDDKPFLYIGHIAIDPNNPNTIYAGTGDPDVPFTVFVGDGVYKSTDGGTTWANIGLTNTKIISKIIVSPNNSQEVYVAALGNPIVADNNRGIYKSTNGGSTWSQVLFINNQTGVSDMVMNPITNTEVYATSYTCIRNATVNIRVSNDARVYKTTDAGSNWNILLNGLPNYKVNKYGICMSNQNPNKLYVAVSDSLYGMGGVYVTNDGGANFINMGNNGISGNYGGFGWYFGEIACATNNDMEVYIAGVELFKSNDGGANWTINQPPWWQYAVHADIHCINPIAQGVYYLGTDGGCYLTSDDGTNYSDVDEIPNTQFYRVAKNPHNPADFWGGTQDNGTIYGNASQLNNWIRDFGGDGFQPMFDPSDPNTYYAETQNGGLWATIDGGVNWTNNNGTIDGNDRRNWDMPIVKNNLNANIQYTGTYRVYKNNAGPNDNWTAISNDLTDGLIFEERFHNISAIDNSEINAQLIYVGTSDANVWVSTNDGGNWTNITGTLPNRYVTSVHASPNNTTNVYVTHTGYKYNSYTPHVHKSINNGSTWVDISGNLPQAGVNDIAIVPGNENMLFVATDIGVYVTMNGGTNWVRVGQNMPVVSVWDIEYDVASQRIYAGTYGKSLLSYDVNQVTVGLMSQLFKPTPMKLYPSIVTDEFTIENNISEDIGEIKIYDTNGKLMKRVQANQAKAIVNINEFKSGMYLVELGNRNNNEVKRIIKN